MRIAESSLDDLLSETVEALRRSGLEVEPTKGAARELIGVTLELSNPKMGLIRSRGHFPKGGYDVPDGATNQESAPTPAV